MGASGLGSLLVKEGFLTEQDRLTITKTCGQGSWAFAKSIVAMGLLDEDELAAFFAERTRYQIAPKDFLHHLDQDAVESFDRRLISKLEVIPLRRESGKITVGVVDPLDKATLKQLEFFTGLDVNPVVVPLSQLYEGLAKIDPSFRRQPTALTHFLQNHAQSAWVRQKLDANETRAGRLSTPTLGGRDHPPEELFEEVTEIEELEDEAIEMEDLDAQDAASGDEGEGLEDPANEVAMAGGDDEVDPFGGTTELPSGDGEMVVDDLDHFGSEDEEDASALGGNLLDRLHDKEEAKPKPTNAVPDEDFEQPLDILSPKAEPEDAPEVFAGPEAEDGDGDKVGEESLAGEEAEAEDFSVAEDAEEMAFDDGVREDDEAAELRDAGSEGEDMTLEGDYEMPEVSTFGFEETKPRGMPSQSLSDDFGVPEETAGDTPEIGDSIDPQPPSDDLLDALSDDDQPTLDISQLAVNASDSEDRLLADLRPLDDEAPLSRIEDPAFTLEDAFAKPEAARPVAEKGAFDDDEETNINLHAARPAVDDDDIQLHPKAPREPKDSGLNPTSTLNEMILKLSLSFSPAAAQGILESYLPRVCAAGCLVNTADQRQFLWSGGRLMPEQLGAAAILPMQGGLDDRKWKSAELKASESWSGKAMKVRVFKDGKWLWAHSLSEGSDSAIFRETVESAMSQAGAKLGAG